MNTELSRNIARNLFNRFLAPSATQKFSRFKQFTALFSSGIEHPNSKDTATILLCDDEKLQSTEENNVKHSISTASSPSDVRSKNSPFKHRIKEGPSLEHFIHNSVNTSISVNENSRSTICKTAPSIPYLPKTLYQKSGQKVFFDIYGCQMNVNDSEVIWSILQSHGYKKTETLQEADIVLVVTCAIREGAETKVWNKLKYLRGLKNKRAQDKHRNPMKIGVIGCMAERLKEKLVEREKAVDIVAGPDSYRDLPRLLALTEDNQTAVNVMLSFDETYADVMPVRLNQNSVSAFVSIMRGCDNMCSYCIVPFTRGRERSRPISSILEEVRYLSQQGVKEVTLLGQNVNSYRDLSEIKHPVATETSLAKGFRTVYKMKKGGLRFADLLEQVSAVDSEMRIRFTSPHPKDFPDEVLHLIHERDNICSNLHLPAQSGNSAVLERMRRGYTREAYLELVDHVRKLVPGVALSSDFICGFCGETDEEFEDTISLIKHVKYNMAYLFPYSLREKTHAHRRYVDNIEQDVKLERLQNMVSTFRSEVEQLNNALVGSKQLVLVEGVSKRSNLYLAGRNDANTKVIFPAGEIPETSSSSLSKNISPGDYIVVQVNSANSQVLKGIPLYHSSISEYSRSDRDHHLISSSHLEFPYLTTQQLQ